MAVRSPLFHAIFFTDVALGQMGLGRPNADGLARGSIQAYHKSNVPGDAPYCVPNEYICAEIGRLLGLPIPPVSLTSSPVVPNQTLFSSLDFDWERESLVDAEPDVCAAQMLDVSTGVALFDILIANPDREHWNLKVDHPTKPTLLRVFDHGHALFGTEGASRFTRIYNDIGLRWPWGVGRHCLLEYLTDGSFVPKWLDRIAQIPVWFIEHLCGSVAGNCITDGESQAAAKFLEDRKIRIESFLIGHADSFWHPATFLNHLKGAQP